jgi:small subunit ribosomal protein S5
VNFAKATFNALRATSEARVPQHAREEREVIE